MLPRALLYSSWQKLMKNIAFRSSDQLFQCQMRGKCRTVRSQKSTMQSEYYIWLKYDILAQ